VLVSRDSSPSNWPHRLWTFDQHHQFIGGPGGAGIGYGLPAAVGATSRIAPSTVRVSASTSERWRFMYAPGALWTASHHKMPMLTIMWNNRAYHQEIMHLQRMANWRQRDVTTAHIGTTIWTRSCSTKSSPRRWVRWASVHHRSERSWRRRPPRYRGSEDGRTCSHQRRLSAALRGASLMKLPVSLALAAAVSWLGASSAFAAQAAPAGDAAKGKANFERVGCYQCHGHQGQGGREGPRIADPVPLAWPALQAWVRTTSGDMPPYTPKSCPTPS